MTHFKLPGYFNAKYDVVQEYGNVFCASAKTTKRGTIRIRVTDREGSCDMCPVYRDDEFENELAVDVFEFCVENNIFPFCALTYSSSITLGTIQHYFESKQLTILDTSHKCSWSAEETLLILYQNMLRKDFNKYEVDGYKAKCDCHESDDVMVKPGYTFGN